LLSRLERGDVHLAIVATHEGRFPGRLLFPTYVLAVLPERHRLSRRTVLEVHDLADEPVLRLNQSFASHAWFEAACQLAHIRPRVLLESAAPQTLISLAQTGYGIAIVPSPVRIAREQVRVLPVVHRGIPLGRWMVVAWDARRFQARYAEQFVEEIVDHCRRDYPGRDFTRRARPLPRPKGTHT
jgi:LysR family cyn operon transcriptional activator